RGRGDRHRCRGHRFAHAAAARPRNHRRVGQEDRPLPGRARGDADLRLRRRAVRTRAGKLFLSLGGAGRPRRRLGHAVPARAGMTDKATVEIPSPADGEVLWLGAEIGQTVAVGAPIVRLKVAGEGNAVAGGVPAKAEPAKSSKEAARVEAAPKATAKPAEPEP